MRNLAPEALKNIKLLLDNQEPEFNIDKTVTYAVALSVALYFTAKGISEIP
jgi:hypothetical protein